MTFYKQKHNFLPHSVYVTTRLILEHCTLTNLPLDYISTHTLTQNLIFLLNTIIKQFARNRIKIIILASDKINFSNTTHLSLFTILGIRPNITFYAVTYWKPLTAHSQVKQNFLAVLFTTLFNRDTFHSGTHEVIFSDKIHNER